MNFYEKLLEYRNGMPVARSQNIRTVELREGYARGVMTISEDQQNLIGSVHGGILMTFADTIGGSAAYSYGEYATTLSCSVNFLNAALDAKRLFAEAVVEKRGRRTMVIRVVITDESEKKLLVSSFTFFNMEKKIAF